METLAKSDAFFFVTTIAVVLLTIMALIILFYLLRVARAALIVSKKIKAESENLVEDIAAMRARVAAEGFGIRSIFKLFGGFFGNTMGKKKRASSSKKSGGSHSAHTSDKE